MFISKSNTCWEAFVLASIRDYSMLWVLCIQGQVYFIALCIQRMFICLTEVTSLKKCFFFGDKK